MAERHYYIRFGGIPRDEKSVAWTSENEIKGEEPGVYKVGFGQNCDADWAKPVTNKMWAEVSEDGLTVTVREEIPV